MSQSIGRAFVGLSLCTAAYFAGTWHQRQIDRPTIDGVKTWFQLGRSDSDPTIHHQVYPKSGDPWFRMHSPGIDCRLCRGDGAITYKEQKERREREFQAKKVVNQ